jgi:alanine-glyoxylate transaminase/serine-glyoxylate transaminase/serine-pyruvate transaminase
MEEVKAGLRYIFQTENDWTLPLTGSGHIAMESLLNNILEPKDTILIPVNGLWGQTASEMSRRAGKLNM